MEAEKITILEGPTPEFQPAIQLWNWSILEGVDPGDIGHCELRTGNGNDIQDRCRRAWREGRQVLLDYPDEMRMRQTIPVVALRLNQEDEGTVLNLWVWQPIQEGELVADDEDGSDDDDLVF
jgi:hypothetical protein